MSDTDLTDGQALANDAGYAPLPSDLAQKAIAQLDEITQSLAAIDKKTFAALQDMAGADFVVELVNAFLEEAPVMLSTLSSSLESGDAEKFRRTAHSLKSNSKTFGADALAEIARDLEHSGLGEVRAREDPLAAVNAEYARVSSALRELCA